MSFNTAPQKEERVSYEGDVNHNNEHEPIFNFPDMEDLTLDAYDFAAIPNLPLFPLTNETCLSLLPHATLDSDFNWRIPSQVLVPKSYDGRSTNGEVTFDEPQSLLPNNGDAITNSPNFDSFSSLGAFYPENNNHYQPIINYPSEVETNLGYKSTYPDPVIAEVDYARKMTYNNNNDFVAAPAMGASIPRTPQPPSRYHDLTHRIEESARPSVASPTPLANGGWLSTSTSPDDEAYGDTPAGLADEGELAEEDSNNATVDARDATGEVTMFASLTDALAWQQRQQADAGKVQDTTVPSDEEKPAFVAKLVAAFGYMGPEAKDCTRTTQGHITSALAHPEVIEIMCWDLLEKTIRRSEGKALSTLYDLLDARSEEGTFAQRIKGVIKGMRISKNACKHLFDAPFASRIVDAPLWEIRKVGRNSKNNKRKQGQLKKANQMSKIEKAQAHGGDGAKDTKTTEGQEPVDDDETEDEEEPKPKKARIGGSKKA
jgi:hypothetical protein